MLYFQNMPDFRDIPPENGVKAGKLNKREG
jgi:hypothetical protein